VILSHRKPDGDTLGSAFGLLYALESLGKTARVECEDGFPEHYAFLYGAYVPAEFEPGFVVAVDIASRPLLGELKEKYASIDLCIDHHHSNEQYADRLLLNASAAATAQVMYRVIVELGAEVDKRIADALYTGISTDSGCFKYESVTADTHRIAAELIERGADHAAIDKKMFDTKSRGRIELERFLYDNFLFCHDGKCVISSLSADIMTRLSLTEEDMDGVSALGRKIEGVMVSAVIRENPDGGSFRVSLRSENPADVSKVCIEFGGGGHCRAAGCIMRGTLEDVKQRLIDGIGREFARL
jgi:phosphoesterase RecJ-like protein